MYSRCLAWLARATSMPLPSGTAGASTGSHMIRPLSHEPAPIQEHRGQHAFKYPVVPTCEGAVVCVPAPGQGGVRGAAHDDGVEHAHRRAAQQLRGRRGQRGEVQRVAEVVVNPLRPLAEGSVPGSRGPEVTRFPCHEVTPLPTCGGWGARCSRPWRSAACGWCRGPSPRPAAAV